MKVEGKKPEGLEVGNAWALHEEGSKTNWIVGQTTRIPPDSLRFMPQDAADHKSGGRRAKNLAVKWFVHNPTDPADWGDMKPTSMGRSLSLLAGEGEFELVFSSRGEVYKVTLDNPGDFAIWGPGLEHSWKPIKQSTIITIRWEPLESD